MEGARLLTRIEEGQPMDQIFHNAVSENSIGFGQRIGIGSTWTAIIGLVALLALTGTGAAASELTPTESVKSTITEVVRILNNAELKQPGHAAERRQRVEQVVEDRVSYEEMAKCALGIPWMELTGSERQEFVGLFVQLLRGTLTGRIDKYTGEQVLYLSEQREEQFAEVKTKLAGPKTDTFLDFRLANRLGNWLVYDVIVDGANITGNYHAQFTHIIRDLSYPGLVKRMKEKMLVVKALETTTAP
jgi:phospholipid transport system substrate-binding protein